MKRNSLAVAMFVLAMNVTNTGATEVANSAATKASEVVVKVEKAVKKGVKAAADGVEKRAKATGRTADKIAKKAGVPVGQPNTSRATDPSR